MNNIEAIKSAQKIYNKNEEQNGVCTKLMSLS